MKPLQSLESRWSHLGTVSFLSVKEEIKRKPGEALWFLPACLMVIGYSLIGDVFAKSGIDLFFLESPTELNTFRPKLFPMECFTIWLFILVLLGKLGGSRFPSAWRQGIGALNPLLATLLFLFVFGALRILVDLPQNPVLVIRNSCFIWYLITSFLLYILDPSLRLLQSLFAISFWCVLVKISIFVLRALTYQTTIFYPDWVPFIGPYYFFWQAFSPGVGGIFTGAWAIISFAFGLGLREPLQRTVMLGIFLVMVSAILAHCKGFKRRWLIPLCFWMTFSIFGYFSPPFASFAYHAVSPLWKTDQVEREKKSLWKSLFPEDYLRPLSPKSESGTGGLELFRSYMWKDAAKLFVENPALGVGFEKQVVFRLYVGSGVFYPNVGSSDGTPSPPLSGPHNSYLNALARVGALGILLLVIHIWILWILWREKLFVIALGLFAQILYAMFNVGLESPQRSFLIYFAITAAMLLVARSRKENPTCERVPSVS